MSAEQKKGITYTLVGLLIAFFSFWSVQTSACAEQIIKLHERVDRLEDRTLDLIDAKKDLSSEVIELQRRLAKCEGVLE